MVLLYAGNQNGAEPSVVGRTITEIVSKYKTLAICQGFVDAYQKVSEKSGFFAENIV